MIAKPQKSSIDRAMVKPVTGGWVSYTDPKAYPKAHFGETKPYFAPKNLANLNGPDSGAIKLPHTVYWGPDRWFNLTCRSSLHQAYQMILEEGSIEDIILYLDRNVLLSIWKDLSLPPRLFHLWEHNVEGLANV